MILWILMTLMVTQVPGKPMLEKGILHSPSVGPYSLHRSMSILPLMPSHLKKIRQKQSDDKSKESIKAQDLFEMKENIIENPYKNKWQDTVEVLQLRQSPPVQAQPVSSVPQQQVTKSSHDNQIELDLYGIDNIPHPISQQEFMNHYLPRFAYDAELLGLLFDRTIINDPDALIPLINNLARNTNDKSLLYMYNHMKIVLSPHPPSSLGTDAEDEDQDIISEIDLNSPTSQSHSLKSTLLESEFISYLHTLTVSNDPHLLRALFSRTVINDEKLLLKNVFEVASHLDLKSNVGLNTVYVGIIHELQDMILSDDSFEFV